MMSTRKYPNIDSLKDFTQTPQIVSTLNYHQKILFSLTPQQLIIMLPPIFILFWYYIRMNDSKLINAWMAQKAGMKNINHAEIAKKVEEITKGTNKAIHEQELDKKRQIEIAKMKQKIQEYRTSTDKDTIKSYMKKRLEMIEMRRDLSRVWAHFDFDMFYIACQLLDNPEDVDKPCAVGTPESVLCTANYVARQYGVRSALPTFIAMKLCPQLILYKPNFQKYKKYSKMMRSIMQKYDQNFQSLGLDEVYIDITNYVKDKSYEETCEFVRGIRQEVFTATGLTVSCGVGANRQLCKMASQQKKPNDQFILPNDKQEIIKYLSEIPIRKIPGIGPVTEHYLKGLGVHNIKQILQRLDQLSVALSDNTIQSLIESCLGIDRNYHQSRQRKSVGRSETFRPIDSKAEIDNKLVEISQSVSQDLNQLGMLCKHIAVGYQTDKYDKKEKSRTLQHYINDKNKILLVARQLIDQFDIKQKVRLISIRCTQLLDETQFKQNSIEAFMAKKKAPTKIDSHQINSQEVQGAVRVKSVQPKTQRKMEQQKTQSEYNVSCPICSKIIQTKGNNIILNKHIDKCLQNGGVQVQEDNRTQLGCKKTKLSQQQMPKKAKKGAKKQIKNKQTIFGFFEKPK